MKTREQAIEHLVSVMHHFRHAIEQAKITAGSTGTVGLGILAVRPDGSGRIIAQLEAPEFFEDLALVIGARPSTDEEKAQARLTQIIDEGFEN